MNMLTCAPVAVPPKYAFSSMSSVFAPSPGGRHSGCKTGGTAADHNNIKLSFHKQLSFPSVT